MAHNNSSRLMSLNLQLSFSTRSYTIHSPSTFSELLKVTHALFGQSSYRFTYLDQQGDQITISSDYDLNTAIDTYTSQNPHNLIITIEDQQAEFPPEVIQIQKTLSEVWASGVSEHQMRQLIRDQLELSAGWKRNPYIWYNFSCSSCHSCPIRGVRYQCTICKNFNLCEICEGSLEHPHAMKKLKEPIAEVPVFEVEINMEPKKVWRKFEKIMGCSQWKKPKMKFIDHVNFRSSETVDAGAKIVKVWKVKNDGKCSWPEKTVLKCQKGELRGVPVVMPPLGQGEVLEIGAEIQTPMQEGRYFGIWRMYTEDGKAFGNKLNVAVSVRNNQETSLDTKIEILTGMGFQQEEVLAALKAHNGDINQAFNSFIK